MSKQIHKLAERFFLGEDLTHAERRVLAESKQYNVLFDALNGSRTTEFEKLAEQVAPLPATVSDYYKPKASKRNTTWGHINRNEISTLVDEIEDKFNVHPFDFSDLHKYDKMDPAAFEKFIYDYVEKNIFDDSTADFIIRIVKDRVSPKAVLQALYTVSA